MKSPLFTDAEREAIRVAVAEAETRTAGEIVPYVVRRSGTYQVAVWRAASFGALLVAAVSLAVAWAYEGWGLSWIYSAGWMAVAMTLGGVLGALVGAGVDGVRRLLAGADRLDERVHRRAAEAFLEEEVFDTRDRTGILFVSLFEHRIEVVGDVGINAKVKQEEWVEVVDLIRTGILNGSLAAGMISAINRCGDLLHRRGVEIREDDTDELSDEIRVRDE